MRRLILVAAILLTACGGSDRPTDPAQIDFAGTYTLRTVNGQPLPYVILQSGANSVLATADQMTIADGGTWSEVLTLKSTENGVVSNQTTATNGTWLRSGSSLTLVNSSTGNVDYTGTFTSNQLVMTGNGTSITFVWQK